MTERASRGRLVAAAVVGAIVLIVASFAMGRLSVPVDRDPTTTSVEAGFARDMQVHHQQAVELALLVRDRTDDAEVRLLAYDIATSQAQQAGQMYGWLAEWGLAQAPAEPPMTWMARPPLSANDGQGRDDQHAHSAAPGAVPATMPGYATAEQIAELSTATDRDAERLFLELMIVHHEGGVEMAQAVLDRSDERVVTDLARSILAAQQSEIELMRSMLAARAG